MLNKTNAAKAVICLLLTALLSGSLLAQKTITGKVTGPDAKALAGVTVAVKGTVVATVTSADGNYSIVMPAKSEVLIFSSVWYELSEVSVNKNNNTVDVAMKLQATSLNEVVVTGYTAQRKKELTGAVSVIKPSELTKVAAPSFLNQIEGRAAGVGASAR